MRFPQLESGVSPQLEALALRVLADRLDHDEGPRGPVSVSFETSPAA